MTDQRCIQELIDCRNRFEEVNRRRMKRKENHDLAASSLAGLSKFSRLMCEHRIKLREVSQSYAKQRLRMLVDVMISEETF